MTRKVEAVSGRPEHAEFLIEPILLLPEGASGVEAAWLRPPTLPLAEEARPVWAETLLGLQARMERRRQGPLHLDVYLQMTQLERPAGPLTISRNGSKWMPTLTFGVWPDREPPAPLSKEDFFNLQPGVPMREPYFHLMRLSAPTAPARVEAATAMAGSGALLLTLAAQEAADRDRRTLSDTMREYVLEEELRHYPSYLPLLDASSLRHLSPEVLNRCLAGVEVYLREDLLEHAALLVSRVRLRDLFAKEKAPERYL